MKPTIGHPALILDERITHFTGLEAAKKFHTLTGPRVNQAEFRFVFHMLLGSKAHG